MSENIKADGSASLEEAPDEKRVALILLAGLFVSIAIFTVLHHVFPFFFDVPSLEGIPMSSYPAMFVADAGVILLSWLCFRHAWKRLGLYYATVFLVGSFVFTGIEESMWILIGRWAIGAEATILSASGEGMVANGTYYFTKGFFWFLETPVTACFGWFLLAYSTVYMAELLIPKARMLWKAAMGGFLATNVDFWADPVQTHDMFQAWVWADLPGGVLLFGIPLTNFIGWFLLIFLFALVFDKLPDMVKKRGPGRAMLYFYGILMALEIAILVSFMIYGTFQTALISPPVNITLFGVGS
jgi:hypothetical protein